MSLLLFSGAFNPASLVIDIDFTKISSIPSEWTYKRPSKALGRDADGFFTSLNSGEPDLRANDGIVLYPEYVVKNNYTRPSSGSVTDHFKEYRIDNGTNITGPFTDIASVVSIATDPDNPGKNLTPNGDKVWEVDNTGTATDTIILSWAGDAGNTSNHSGFLYTKTLEGSGPEFDFMNDQSAEFAESYYFTDGYTRHEIIDEDADSDTNISLAIDPGSHVYITMVNFQEIDTIMPGFDTTGSSATVSSSLVEGTNTDLVDRISTEGTIVMDFEWINRDSSQNGGGDVIYFIFQNPTFTENIRLRNRGTGAFALNFESDNVWDDHGLNLGFKPFNDENTQFAIGYEPGGFDMVLNGTNIFTDTATQSPDASTFTSISFGRATGQPDEIVHPMYLRRFRYFDKRLNESTLKRLTDLSEHIFVAGAGQSLMDFWSDFAANDGETQLLRALRKGGGAPEFVNGATSGSALLEESGDTDYWINLNDTTGNAYASFDNTLTSSVSDTREDTIDFIIWQQGTADLTALDNGTYTGAQYAAALNALFDQFKADYGDQIRFVIGLYGRYTLPPSQSAVQILREAQKSVIESRSDTFFGCEIYDLPQVDGIHLNNEGRREHGRRMGARINAIAGRLPEQGTLGPSIAGATYNGTHIDITISHDAGEDLVAGPYDAGLFRVEDDGSPVTVNSVSKTGSASVRLVLDTSIVSGSDVKLWHVYGGISSVTGTFIKDNATDPMPLQSIAELVVSEG